MNTDTKTNTTTSSDDDMKISISADIFMWMFTVVMVMSGNNRKYLVMVASDVMDDMRHVMMICCFKVRESYFDGSVTSNNK